MRQSENGRNGVNSAASAAAAAAEGTGATNRLMTRFRLVRLRRATSKEEREVMDTGRHVQRWRERREQVSKSLLTLAFLIHKPSFTQSTILGSVKYWFVMQ